MTEIRLRATIALLGYGAFTALAMGCTSLATVRSASLQPGPTAHIQGAVASPPGEEAGWFWRDECASSCNKPVAAVDVSVGYNFRLGEGSAVSANVGTNGVYPYVDGFVQLNGGKLPFGVGGRIGIPLDRWNQYQIYGRLDVPLGAESRLLWNPGLFIHSGETPNGLIDGSFVGLVQGLGIEFGNGPVTIIPAVALVVGRAEREGYGEKFGPATSVFATASIGISIHKPRR